ncbi:serine hydrolase domain-containing protein [Aquimarina spongiae]|uniref:CubicO group peptidase, beta-lactamase class C family n=1 Tax=Aquimarina spongiae TaxID=570521 RepID=A0A1M6I1K8_9FLAO|nr:serine hydrolase domain-containing protein [Aquimarina spongiae]SHJ28359.1 CubicO group peptidase, beta-lactamase class C family [Aquimarina spongiae]
MKNLFLVFTLSILFFSCKQKKETPNTLENSSAAINDTLTKNLKSAFEKEAIIGFSVAVVDDKGLIYENGFGYTDIEQKKPYTSNTTQNIASISKTLIGIALLKAQELGKLNIDDPINNYLPFKIINPHYPEQPILIKHLAYHTSSITDLDEVYSKSYVLEKSKHNDNEGVYEWFSKPEDKISQIEFMRNSLTENGKWYQNEIFLKTEPGKTREYSNIGAGLCAYIIESATGQSYESFTKEYILKPLKMKASGWSSKDIDTTNRSRLFAHQKMMIAEYSLITKADGGFITSSQDLGLFLTELIKGYKGSGTLLSKASYQKLFEKQQFPNVKTNQEFGIFMEFSDEFIRIKDQIIGHNGSDPGVMTAMYFNPETEIGRILLVNTDSDFNDNFWPEVQEIWRSLIHYESQIDTNHTNR